MCVIKKRVTSGQRDKSQNMARPMAELVLGRPPDMAIESKLLEPAAEYFVK